MAKGGVSPSPQMIFNDHAQRERLFAANDIPSR